MANICDFIVVEIHNTTYICTMIEPRQYITFKGLPEEALIAEIMSRDETIDVLLETVNKLRIQVNYFNKKTYASTSEKSSVVLTKEQENTDSYLEYEDVPKGSPGEPASDTHKDLDETSEIVAPAKAKRKYKQPHPGRSPLPEQLERRHVYINLEDFDPARDRSLAPLRSEKLVLVFECYVEVTNRQCIMRDGLKIVASFPENHPFYKHKLAVQSMGLLATMRYQLQVPCYRLHQLLLKNTIGYNTMLESMSLLQELLKPLGPVALIEVKKDAKLLHIDEIPYDSLDSPEAFDAFKNKSDLLSWKNAGKYPGDEGFEEEEGPEKDEESSVKKESTTEDKGASKTDNKTKDIEKKNKKSGKKKQINTGRLWVLANEAKPLVYIFSSMTRKANIAEWLLGDYAGLLMADAYPGYLSIARNKSMKVILMLCWAHARRRFTSLVLPNKSVDPVLKEAIRRIGELYKIEKRIKGKSDEEIFVARQESIQLLISFKIFLEEKRKLYTPKDAVTEAIDYLLNHWEFFIEFTNHSNLGVLDNNFCERKIRPITINRKNSMFFGSAESSSGAALMFTLVENCKLHNVNFIDYINDVVLRIQTHPQDKLDELLPHKWKPLERPISIKPTG